MEELSIEEKAKRYDEALDKARKLYNSEETSADVEIGCENIFPELIESEDEKIKRCIGDVVRKYGSEFTTGTVTKEKMFAWLEKQGQVKESPISQHENKKCKENDDSLTSEDDSKFKVGDWIVKDNIVYHIDKISGVYLTLSTLDGTALVYHISVLDSEYTHLWTIQDAKEGDVLVTPNKNILIFRSIKDTAIYDYCGSYFGEFHPESSCVNGTIWSELPKGYLPATGNQRDLLFQKMKEAGYKWDSNKKELKKIEKKRFKEKKEPKFKVGNWS